MKTALFMLLVIFSSELSAQWKAKEIVAEGTYIALSYIDVSMTLHAIKSGMYAEGNPILGKTNSTIISRSTIISLAHIFIADRIGEDRFLFQVISIVLRSLIINQNHNIGVMIIL
ncbi:MAG: hypothetical protein IMZ53_01135 [Thermoplasmata archaeon]|nr:hypothetical protein [Thermoplasmata archaeon]